MSNITCYDSDGVALKQLYQWDMNQTITIKGADVSPLPLVHFCNKLSDKAIVVEPTLSGNDLKAAIPNILLQQPEPLIVYIYQQTTGDGDRTRVSIYIPIVPRKEPEDYIFEENIPGWGTIDQTYDPDSERAQSGLAVKEAIDQHNNDLDAHSAIFAQTFIINGGTSETVLD